MIAPYIYDALSDIGIPLVRNEYHGNESVYAIWNIVAQKDTDTFDDENESELYLLAINLWFETPNGVYKAREIKNKLKTKGFAFLGSKDLKHDVGHTGISMSFEYKIYLKQEVPPENLPEGKFSK